MTNFKKIPGKELYEYYSLFDEMKKTFHADKIIPVSTINMPDEMNNLLDTVSERKNREVSFQLEEGVFGEFQIERAIRELFYRYLIELEEMAIREVLHCHSFGNLSSVDRILTEVRCSKSESIHVNINTFSDIIKTAKEYNLLKMDDNVYYLDGIPFYIHSETTITNDGDVRFIFPNGTIYLGESYRSMVSYRLTQIGNKVNDKLYGFKLEAKKDNNHYIFRLSDSSQLVGQRLEGIAYSWCEKSA